jgi:hypothetical protein
MPGHKSHGVEGLGHRSISLASNNMSKAIVAHSASASESILWFAAHLRLPTISVLP